MKRIYFLFGTALLLCCLVNFNVAQAQTEAVATWPLTSEVGGVATISGEISAADQGLINTEINGYTGPNSSQRVRIAGNEWPALQEDTVTGTYIQFAVAPNVGNSLNISTISFDMAAAGIQEMRARVFFSTDPNFASANVTEIEYTTENENNYLSTEALTAVSATPDVTVADGENFYLRIYPWVNNDPDVRTGKYVTLQNVVVSGTTSEGTACTPDEMTPYIEVVLDGASQGWNEINTATVDAGATINFGPWPRSTPEENWAWTGPNDWTYTGREPSIENIQANQAGTYTATYENAEGCVGTQEFTITVNGTDPDPDPTDAINVHYVTSNKEMAEGASDPILAMLQADENLNVTLFSIAGDSTVDLSGADVIVAQEGFGSGDAIFMPGGSLALATLPAPTVYNKTYALRNGRAVVTGGGTSAEAAGVAITVPAANQDHELFNGITLVDNAFNVFDSTSNDSGAPGTKALNYTSSLTISATNTLVGTAAETTDPDSTVFLNIIPQGTTVGDQVVGADMVMMGMNFGTISRGGNNVTTEGLTLWRNAVYMLGGLTVPETPVGEDPGTDEGTIVFVTPLPASDTVLSGEGKDDEQIQWLMDQGFNVELYYNNSFSTASQEDIDMLNAADLIIIGRGTASNDFGGTSADDKTAWNNLTAPVILNSQWAARSSRLNWFNSTSIGLTNPTAAEILNATVLDADDPAFSGASLSAENTMPWSTAPEDVLFVTEETNGTVLATAANPTLPEGATAESGMLFVRFEAGTPFYATATDTPAGERIYFGFGNDNSQEAADNFFALATEAREVYKNEIMRFIGEPGGGTTVSVASNPTPADDAADVDTEGLALSWEGDGETYNVYWGTSVDNLELAEGGEGLTTASFTPASIAEGTEYFWRVDAMAEGAETAVGPVWSFTTGGEPSNDATLADLTVNDTQITGFDPATQTYTMNLPAGTTSVVIGVETTDAGATVTGAETITLEEGDNEHTVVVTAADGTTMEYTINFVVAPTKVTGLAAEGVEIYPNPVNGNGTLHLRNAKELVAVNVYTAQGVLVRSITAGNSGNISIQVSDLAEGLYLLKAVKQDRSVLTGKFVK